MRSIDIYLLQQKAVRIATGLGPEYRQNQAKEESKQGQTDYGKESSLANVPFVFGRLDQQNHAHSDEEIENHDEISLQDELALKFSRIFLKPKNSEII